MTGLSGPTAAFILIGNELLSGKIQDANAAYAIPRLRELGVVLRRVVTIPDEMDAIAVEVRSAAAAHDHVFTSGGVGPTHDDVTIECIAAAFEVPVVRHPDLARILREHFGARLTDDHLRMADVPEGAALLHGGPLRWPVIQFRNVYILPGVPEIFRAKFDAIAERFRTDGIALRSLYLQSDEGTIAALLRRIEAAHEVMVGSYPRLDHADHRVRITVEGRAAAAVNAAVDALIRELPPKEVVRVDAPA